MTDATVSALADALRDSYRLERELGRGGMATVYLAHDLKHDRPVAIKVLHSELAATLGPERFLREIRLAARLQHPHILTVLDSGEAADRLWFTMPYVEGESLRDRLQREKQLPVDDAVRITREAALALDFAHRHGVIHRDVKPENILLCDSQALLADFGVGRALGLPTPSEQLTLTSTVVGTPAYMSPEQASGDQALDGRADIYSLGLVLYEMLVGEAPFTGPTAQAILSRRLTEAPRPLRQVRQTVPEAIEQAVLRALERAPADRFQSGAEFAQALALHTPSASTASASPRPTSRHRLQRALTLSGAALGILATAAVILWQRRKPAPTPLEPNLIAIAPFDVPQPSLNIWREGLVDLLARNLDGAGPLRTVSPAVVVRRWQGRADRTSAAALGRHAGAGLVVYGALVGRGQDSVRLAARLLDVSRDEVVGEAEVRGTADRVDELADSLTLRVLRDLSQSRQIAAVRASSLGSSSLEAIRSFLHAEQYFRRAEWDSARASYERAVAVDTVFALAYWRLGTVRGWQFGIGDSLSEVYSRRAAALNHGLAPRDSLLIACDSLMTAVRYGLPDSSDRANLHRLFRTGQVVTTRYPSDPEAWVALGEARYHYGEGLGVSDEMRLAAFDRAIALDSSYAPAYIHAVDLALRLNNRAGARRYLARYLALRPGRDGAIAATTKIQILNAADSGAALARLLDSLPPPILFEVWFNLQLATDSAEIAVQIARRLGKPGIGEDLFGQRPGAWFAQGILAGSLDYRGHLRESARVVMAQHQLQQWALFAELALAGAIPADTADAFYSRRLRRDPFWSASDPFEQEGLNWALAWWAARGDSTSLKRFLERIDRPTPSEAAPSGPVRSLYWKTRGRAYLALARHDTATALSGLRALPDSSRGLVWLDRLTLAQLLAAGGRVREALAVLDGELPHDWVTGTHGPWALERARLAEKLGEREKAKHWYGYVVALWRYADPELQPLVAEAKEALARLTAESGT